MNFNDRFARFESKKADSRIYWPLFRHKPLEMLEKFYEEEQDLDPSIKASLAEFIRLRRRRTKARLQDEEKSGEYFEKMALPVAAAIGFVGSVCVATLNLSVLTPEWKTLTTLGFNVAGAITWYFIRQHGIRRIKEARRQLTLLGYVD